MIDKIKMLKINEVYNFDDCLSINELLCKFYEKINDIIGVSNESINLLEWLKDKGLSDEIVYLMTEWYDNGKLSEIINVQKFEQLKSDFQTFVNENITELRDTLTTQTNSQNTKLNELQTALEICEGDIETNYNYINSVENNCKQSLAEYKTTVSSNYQPMKDTTLNTNSKMIVGAINEIKANTDVVKQNGANGFRQLSDGLMLQWGSVIIQTAEFIGQTNVVFPKAFKTVYNINVGMEDASGWLSVSVKGRAASGFIVEAKCHKGANDEKYGIGAVRVNWMAIGVV